MRNALTIVTGLALVLGVVGGPRPIEGADPDTCVLRGRYFVTAFSPSLNTRVLGFVTLTPNANCALDGTLAGTVTLKPLGGAPTTLTLGGLYAVGADASFEANIPGVGGFHGLVTFITDGVVNNFVFAGGPPLPTDLIGNGSRSDPSGFFTSPTGSADGTNTATGAGALANNTTGSFNTATGAGALFSNTTGSNNTATGANTLQANTTGLFNTATGQGALFDNTTGDLNTAIGAGALQNNTTGSFNTAIGGTNPLFGNTTGDGNAAIGTDALQANSSGNSNTAIGTAALRGVTTGSSNIALGNNAGSNLTGGDHDNIHIGHPGVASDVTTMRLGSLQTQTFIAGVRGITTGLPAAIPVLIDPTGQLGTISSSRRVKLDIQDMAEGSDALLKLRPVSFRYKTHANRPGPREYGLIAEEVAELVPDLVVYDTHGQPETVRYHLLPALLLNEVQKQHRQLNEQAETIGAQAQTMEAQQKVITDLMARVQRLERLLSSVARRAPEPLLP